MRVLLLALFAKLFVLLQVLGADVSPSTGVLTYVIDSSCPQGWSDLSYDATYKGRLIKGWISSSNLGAQHGNAISDNSVPTHTHPSWSRRMYFPENQRTSCLGQSSYDMVDDGAQFFMNQGNSAMNWKSAGIQRVSLRLCRYTSGITFNLPPNIVVYLHHSVTSCPAGFSDFSDAHGRFLVFGSFSKSMYSDVISPGTPVTNNVDGVGYHTHNMPAATINMKERSAAHIYGCCGPRAAQWISQRTLEQGQADSAHLNIPYVQLRACKSTQTTSTKGLPSSRSIFFYDGDTCPTGWQETTVRGDSPNGVSYYDIASRMIFNLYDGNVAAGSVNTDGDILYCAQSFCSGWGNMAHSHNYGGTFDLPAQKSGCSWDWGLTYWTDYRSYTWYFDTDTSSNQFPYRVMRACSPPPETPQPTMRPSQNPTTSSPSKAPTTSGPSRSPTHKPSGSPTTSKPSVSPTTSRPSTSPTTSRPSTSPTTSRPSTSPTTSRPSKVPSFSPTWSPTPSPVWKNVCNQQDAELFLSYDNYVIQAGRCWSDCRLTILGRSPEKAMECIHDCDSLSQYSGLCRQCMIWWTMTQDDKCRGQCLASKYTKVCADCTNEWARPSFRNCTGLEAADLSLGGGDGGPNAPQDTPINAGLISGVTLGTMLAVAGVIFLGRKYRERRILNDQITKEVNESIFKSKNIKQGTGSLTVTSSSGKARGQSVIANHSLVASDGARESADNPIYTAESNILASRAGVSAPVERFDHVYVRTRFSFHGKEVDELDVDAGATLKALEKSGNWYVCEEERTGRVGLIPASYVANI